MKSGLPTPVKIVRAGESGAVGALFLVPATLTAQVAVSMLQQGLPSISPGIQEQLNLGLTGLGLLLGVTNAATAVTVYAWGRWSDRAGDRRALLMGLPVAAVALAGTACAAAHHSGAVVTVGLLIAGTGAASGTAALARVLADRAPAARLGVLLGLRQAAVPFGGLLAAAVLPLAAVRGGLGAAFAVLSLSCLIAAVAVAIGVPAHPARGSTSPTPPARGSTSPTPPACGSASSIGPVGAPAPAGPQRTSGALDSAAPVPRRPAGLLALMSANACYCVAQTGTVSLSVVAWHRVLGLSAGAATALFTAVQVASVLLRVGLGRLGDRRPGREPVLLAGLGACTATLLAALGLAHTARVPAVAQAGLLLAACLPAAGWNGLAFAVSTRLVLTHRAGARLGRVHGLQNTVLFAAVGLTPPAIAAFSVRAGWAASRWLLAACAAAGALIQHAFLPTPFQSHQRVRQEPSPCTSSVPTMSS